MEPIIPHHIEKRPGRSGEERAYVSGTRVRVQDIASEHELHGLTPEQIAREHPQLSLAHVYAALAYYFDHREEIQRQMKQDEEFADSLEAAFRRRQRGNRDDGDPLPS
jgi:uncharacterized protein (DUF433 family)